VCIGNGGNTAWQSRQCTVLGDKGLCVDCHRMGM
jgi:hypothetical protein